ncbi:polysaccharide deacetylase family protein [Marinobacter mobilis]|uniref:Polysaccharide deacetylase n=1 Tax=Marinobacter mobilis TaxID=488533 RepID=A0A1H2UV77_9GAMM|nr:polysaccharide deacetylase family protein [Marinobacter mobilis]SDW59992.1 Polysaccharide deacetylase [Marinobacter mobilis]
MAINQWIYRVSKPLGGLSLAKFLTRKHPKILMYHRIGNELGRINVDEFRTQLKIIKKYFNPIALNDLVEISRYGNIPDNCVVITFDDGYYDFGELAFPLLKEECVPATLFLTTGFVDGNVWLWPDKLKYVLNNTDLKNVEIEGFDFDLVSKFDNHEAWNLIADYCLTLPDYKKTLLIESLFHKLEVVLPDSIPKSQSAVNWEKVNEFISNGIEIGSHSVTHPVLKNVDEKQLTYEVVNSKSRIFDMTGYEVQGFCYPNGMPEDFDERVEYAVRAAGYQYAISAYPGINPLNNRWAINRYPAQSNLENFEKNLYGFTRLNMKNK